MIGDEVPVTIVPLVPGVAPVPGVNPGGPYSTIKRLPVPVKFTSAEVRVILVTETTPGAAGGFTVAFFVFVQPLFDILRSIMVCDPCARLLKTTGEAITGAKLPPSILICRSLKGVPVMAAETDPLEAPPVQLALVGVSVKSITSG